MAGKQQSSPLTGEVSGFSSRTGLSHNPAMLGDYPYLFTVADRFSIADRGVILVPGIPWEGAPAVKKGDPLILRTPLGEMIETSVRDLEMITQRSGLARIRATPVLLPSDLHKFDIPIGTEVFLGIREQ
jgi:hypothetical protein